MSTRIGLGTNRLANTPENVAFLRDAVRRSVSLAMLGLTAVLLTLGSGAMVAAGVGMWNAPPCCHMAVQK